MYPKSMIDKLKSRINWLNKRREALLWLSALVALYFLDLNGTHISICPISNLGFDFCPGCGLGRSIAHILQGNFHEGMTMHSLGFVALGIIAFRIYTLLSIKSTNNYEQNIHTSTGNNR